MILWPHAWPMPGKLSYSAQMAMCTGPDPARARNAVGRPQMSFSTVKPAPSKDSHSQAEACSSSETQLGMTVNAVAELDAPGACEFETFLRC